MRSWGRVAVIRNNLVTPFRYASADVRSGSRLCKNADD
jgi:hypothetical protein